MASRTEVGSPGILLAPIGSAGMNDKTTRTTGALHTRRWALALLIWTAASCAPDRGPVVPPTMDAGADLGGVDEDARPEPPGAASVRFRLQAAGLATTLPVSVGGLTVESAVLMLHEITLASDNGSAKLEGGWPIDLATGTATLALSNPRPGLYSRLTITFEKPEGAQIPAVFQGQRLSARVSGKLASGATFVFRIASEFRLDLASPTPFDLGPDGRLRAGVSLDVSRWFTGIDFPVGVDPVEIDASRSADLLNRFRSNLTQSGTLSFE